jgi:hypothetical protein
MVPHQIEDTPTVDFVLGEFLFKLRPDRERRVGFDMSHHSLLRLTLPNQGRVDVILKGDRPTHPEPWLKSVLLSSKRIKVILELLLGKYLREQRRRNRKGRLHLYLVLRAPAGPDSA